MMTKLSDRDIRTLRWVAHLRAQGEYDGSSPTTGPQHRHYRRLERIGVLAFLCMGEDDRGRPGSIYQLTALGDLVLKQRDGLARWQLQRAQEET